MKKHKTTILKKFLALLLSCACLISCACSMDSLGVRSIKSTAINSNGELVITYSDGTTENLGKVVGQDGKDGENGQNGKDGKDGQDGKDGATGPQGPQGEAGLGASKTIVDTMINSAGELVITYSDGTTQNLGKVITSQAPAVKKNLKISVLTASDGAEQGRMAVEMTITEKDVGKTLSAYPTVHDVNAKTAIGGRAFTTADVGNEITFVPTKDDVGKVVGLSKYHYKSNEQITLWWEHVENYFNCTVNAVSWSGSGFTSMLADRNADYLTSTAWHDAQIRKLGARIPGTMEREAPDIVILHRAGNDVTKSPYARLTKGYFDNTDWQYPTTDKLSDGTYGLKEAMSLTVGKIRAMYPKTKIVFATHSSILRNDNDNFPVNNDIYSFPKVNEAIRETAAFFGCPVIEFDKANITFENWQNYLKPDGAHPTNEGQKLLGSQAIHDLLYNVNVNEYFPSDETVSSTISIEETSAINTIFDITATPSAREGYYYIKFAITPGYTYTIPHGRNFLILNGDTVLSEELNSLRYQNYQVTITETEATHLMVIIKTSDVAYGSYTIDMVSSVKATS